jgi:ubiquitin carboxyl-terminal hydrolase 34
MFACGATHKRSTYFFSHLQGFPFLYQQIKDNINPHQTRHLICALCRWDERLASQIIEMLFTAVTKHTEV